MNKNPRKVYLRKKGKKLIFECKIKGETIYLWTIPQPYDEFLKELCKSSFFPKDKASKIMTLIASSDYKDVLDEKIPREVPTTNNMRTNEKDENDYEIDDVLDDILSRVPLNPNPDGRTDKS